MNSAKSKANKTMILIKFFLAVDFQTWKITETIKRLSVHSHVYSLLAQALSLASLRDASFVKETPWKEVSVVLIDSVKWGGWTVTHPWLQWLHFVNLTQARLIWED